MRLLDETNAMAASPIRGRELQKQVETVDNGKLWFEILPIDGDFALPLHGSVKMMVDHAEGKGVWCHHEI